MAFLGSAMSDHESIMYPSIFVLMAILLSGLYSKTVRKSKHLPPGPKGLPFLGNVHQMLLDDCLWFKLSKWRTIYGNIFYVNLAGQDVVVLGNNKVAFDLLNRRSYKYSARARHFVSGELMTGGYGVNFLQRNDIWKRSRRAAHEALKPSTLSTYHPLQCSGALNLVDNLLKNAEGWEDALAHLRAVSMYRLIYGNIPTNQEDLQMILDFTEQVVKSAAPDAHFVEYLTWMEYLPRWLAPWRTMAEEWHTKGDALMLRLFDGVKTRIKSGEQQPCIATTAYEDTTNDLNDKETAWMLGTLYAAGLDTTIGTVGWFFVAMAAYPEIQQKAQAQLDKVVGFNRMPNFSDSSSLSYIHAIIKEVFRWRPVAPFAMPHVSEEEDSYEGYFIPKGTLCLANIWDINHDPEIYGPDAHEFRPERFLDESESLSSPIPETHDESHATFGYGRRICVGRHLANETLFITVATMLWAFKISPSKDAAGNPITPRVDDFLDDGLVMRPKDFKCQMTPRFADVPQLVQYAKDLEK